MVSRKQPLGRDHVVGVEGSMLHQAIRRAARSARLPRQRPAYYFAKDRGCELAKLPHARMTLRICSDISHPLSDLFDLAITGDNQASPSYHGRTSSTGTGHATPQTPHQVTFWLRTLQEETYQGKSESLPPWITSSCLPTWTLVR